MVHVTPLAQFAICDFCQARVADRCHIRLQLHMCPRCAVLVEATTGERLTTGLDEDGPQDSQAAA